MIIWAIYVESRDTDHSDRLLGLYATEELAQKVWETDCDDRAYVTEEWVEEDEA